jgi:hypothetical protein
MGYAQLITQHVAVRRRRAVTFLVYENTDTPRVDASYCSQNDDYYNNDVNSSVSDLLVCHARHGYDGIDKLTFFDLLFFCDSRGMRINTANASLKKLAPAIATSAKSMTLMPHISNLFLHAASLTLVEPMATLGHTAEVMDEPLALVSTMTSIATNTLATRARFRDPVACPSTTANCSNTTPRTASRVLPKTAIR